MKRLALLLALLGTFAQAQSAAEQAQYAAEALEEAGVQLDRAQGARDRVAALTDTVRAYEDGLAAMRDGLRNATIRETELTRKLAAQDTEVQELVSVLMTLGADATPQTLLHPQGPLGTARSGMLLGAVTPALVQKAQTLRGDLEEVSALRDIQQSALNRLREGLTGAQEARIALSKAIADRTDLPKRFTSDPIRTQILITSTETLQAFASGLDEISEDVIAENLPRIDALRGTLALPVRGTVLRKAGDPDAAGVARPGIVVATEPRALVTTPVPATIRYNGPLLDYGLVTILEPQADVLIVLAGLQEVYGTTGEVIPEGSPVGLMGGTPPQTGDISSPSGERGGAARSETLYIEVREGDAPVDPLMWFATDKG